MLELGGDLTDFDISIIDFTGRVIYSLNNVKRKKVDCH